MRRWFWGRILPPLRFSYPLDAAFNAASLLVVLRVGGRNGGVGGCGGHGYGYPNRVRSPHISPHNPGEGTHEWGVDVCGRLVLLIVLSAVCVLVFLVWATNDCAGEEVHVGGLAKAGQTGRKAKWQNEEGIQDDLERGTRVGSKYSKIGRKQHVGV